MEQHTALDLAGDSHPAQEPQAAADAERMRADYTQAPEVPPQELNWVATNGMVLVHGTMDHQTMLETTQHSHFSRPHAYGTLNLHNRWDAVWEIERSNMALHLIEKQLKKYCREQGWKFGGIIDDHGMPMETADRKVAAAQGYARVTNPEHPAYGHPVLIHGPYGKPDHNGTQWLAGSSLAQGWGQESVGRRYNFEPSDLEFIETPGELPEHWGKTSMADRSGVPEVDQLIEDFLKEPVEAYGGNTPETILHMRDPENAHGMCQAVTEQFVEFARARGFTAYSTDTDLDEMGYKPSIEPFGEIGEDEHGVMQHGFYPEHTVATIVLKGPEYGPYGRDIYIDFTASQYGYTDHPKVTSKVASGLGEDANGIKDWRHKEWGGTELYDQMPSVDLNNVHPDGENPAAPYVCSECGLPCANYAAWHRHTMEEHTKAVATPADPTPVVDYDAVLPAKLREHSDQMGQAGVVASMRRLLAAPKVQVGDIPGPIPFIYDIESDRIFVGHPGERHSDIQGKYNPSGIVEGVYDPKGNVQIRSMTDMPYSVYHMNQLWYAMHPELGIKSIYLLAGEERRKIAYLPARGRVGEIVELPDGRRFEWRDE